MVAKTLVCVVTLGASVAGAVAQASPFRMDAAVRIGPTGAAITYDFAASPASSFAVFADLFGGPVDVLGERFYLGLSPFLTTLQAGVLPASGAVAGNLSVPPNASLVGNVLYSQAAVVDMAAPNQLFRLSNAESCVPYVANGAIVLDFNDFTGFAGDFSAAVDGHIAGRFRYRKHRTIDPSGVVFPQPLANPLNPNGCREQMVFRPQDVGATGQPEMVTAIHWHSQVPVTADSYSQIEMGLGNTSVAPDFSVHWFSLLPVALDTGMSEVFANNGVTQPVFQGQYNLLPTMQRADGFVPFPVIAPFAYDGTSSLLLEFKTWPDPQAQGDNGLFGRLMVQTSPLPAARTYDGGGGGTLVNPANSVQGMRDCWMADLEITFASSDAQAVSPMLDSGSANPDYGNALMAASLAPGTRVQLSYRGSATATGTPTAWSSTPDIADGLRFLQIQMDLRANPISGDVPVVDTLVVPWN